MNSRTTRLAAVDIGSSAIKYAIYDVGIGVRPKLFFEADPITTALGRGLSPGKPLPAKARRETLDVLADFSRRIAEAGAVVGTAVATQAVRIAGDRDDFVAEAGRILGSRVRVITNEDEARMSFLSAWASLGPFQGPIVNLDPGGSSNDFAYGDGAIPSANVSLEFGMNHLVEIADPDGTSGRVSPGDIDRLMRFLAENYKTVSDRLAHLPRPTAFVATSGAVIAVANVADEFKEKPRHLRSAAAHGKRIDRFTLDRIIREAAPMTTDERLRRWSCLSTSRAPIFVHGCLVYRALLDVFSLDAVIVNGMGLKFGALLEAVGE